MQFQYLFMLLLSAGAHSQRILGCRMPNGSLNPSPNICNQAGGIFQNGGGCCTKNQRDGPAVTESRYVLGCNENGGHGEVTGGSC
ncbi:hypothetical protein ACLX1H_008887 [Fusarium chlamydosporum]